MKHTVKLREWLFPAILVLFILQVILLPVMIGLTYATRSERPEHILTYKKAGSLVWDKDTVVRSDGSASLSFFETMYPHVEAENAETVLAPGTEKSSVIRLKNEVKRAVRYTAVLYEAAAPQELDIQASLAGDGFSDASDQALPEWIRENAIIRTVDGSLGANQMQDFDIQWIWNYEDGTDVRDIVDTDLGDKAAAGKADRATLGFYLIVHDDGEDIAPSPVTGDGTVLGGYIVLLVISGAMTGILGFSRRRNRREE